MNLRLAGMLSTTVVLSLAATAVFAATVSFVKKVPAGPLGNFNYTYMYTCSNGNNGTLEVTSANDNVARGLATQEAADRCGEN